MQINTNYHFSPVNRPGEIAPAAPATASVRSAAAAAPSTEDVASFPNTKRLSESLAATPDIRADKVARARELVKQADYPPAEMVRKIGNLIAGHLDQ